MRPVRTMRTVCALAVALAGLPARGDLVVWNPNRRDESAAFEQVIAAYNARKGAAAPRVVGVHVPFDGLADRAAAAIPRGKGPDVFIFAQDRLGGWVENGGVVAPIDPFMDNESRDRFIPATLEAMSYHGTLWGVPLAFKVPALLYNKALVAAPPRTTAELAALARRLTRRADGTYGLVYRYANYYFHAALQNGFGGGVFDARMAPTLDRPENVSAMELLLRWKQDFLPEESPASEEVEAALFNDGKAAMVIEGPWFRDLIAPTVAYGLAPLPALSEARGQPMRPWLTVEGAYVAAPSRQKEWAWDFLRFASSEAAARIMAVEGHELPANQRAYLDPALMRDQALSAFLQQVRLATPMPNGAEMSLMWSPATVALGAVLRGEAPASALGKAQAVLGGAVARLHPTRSVASAQP